MECCDAKVATGVGRGAVLIEYELYAGVTEVAFAVKEDDGTGVGGAEDGGDGEEWFLVLDRSGEGEAEEDAVAWWGYCDGRYCRCREIGSGFGSFWGYSGRWREGASGRYEDRGNSDAQGGIGQCEGAATDGSCHGIVYWLVVVMVHIGLVGWDGRWKTMKIAARGSHVPARKDKR